MAYVQLIYNPMAGQRMFGEKLDAFVETFQRGGYEVRVKRTSRPEDFSEFFVDRDLEGCAAIIVAGGDGSVNQVLNGMVRHGHDVPIGVMPVGTANDFAKHLGLGENLLDTMERLAKIRVKEIDLGRVNDTYFINVCCGGLFSNISHDIDPEFKNTLGKLAYYIKGVQQLPKFKPMKLRIELPEETIVDDFYMFFYLNGSSAGGFSKLGMDAELDDGKMDLVAIKACPMGEVPVVFAKILQGIHFEDRNVIYRQSESVVIECLDKHDKACMEKSDVDGEPGPGFPLKIEVVNRKIKVLY